MASELKPCLLCEGEAKLLRRSGTAGRVCPSKWYRERVECKVCGLTTREYKKPRAATHSWNTRPAPAATDTGLETLSVELTPSGHPYMKSDPDGDYVTRSQAEELLAAKDRLISDLRSEIENLSSIVSTGIDDVAGASLDDLETDNAALTARVNFLERLVKEQETQITNGEALEAKLAAAENGVRYALANLRMNKSDEAFLASVLGRKPS